MFIIITSLRRQILLFIYPPNGHCTCLARTLQEYRYLNILTLVQNPSLFSHDVGMMDVSSDWCSYFQIFYLSNISYKQQCLQSQQCGRSQFSTTFVRATAKSSSSSCSCYPARYQQQQASSSTIPVGTQLLNSMLYSIERPTLRWQIYNNNVRWCQGIYSIYTYQSQQSSWE